MDFLNSRPRMSMKNSVPLTRNEINSIASSSFGVEKDIRFKAPLSCEVEGVQHLDELFTDISTEIKNENIFGYNTGKFLRRK